jgi:hypothetical protein
MTPGDKPKDLIVLAADLSMRVAVEAVLKRHHPLRIREISYDVFAHPKNDPGVFREAHSFLQAQTRNYQHAVAACDRDGCGKEALPREQLEALNREPAFYALGRPCCRGRD